MAGISAAPPGLILVAEAQAADDATIEFTDLDQYRSYLFMLSNLVPVTDAQTLHMRTSADNGTSFDSGVSDYQYQKGQQLASTFGGNNSGGNSNIVLTAGVGSGANEEMSIMLFLENPGDANPTWIHTLGGLILSDGNIYSHLGTGRRAAAAAVNAVQFYFASGNIESGKITVYGIR